MARWLIPTTILLLVISIPFDIMALSFAASWIDGEPQTPVACVLTSSGHTVCGQPQ